jgi:hypothetical protein
MMVDGEAGLVTWWDEGEEVRAQVPGAFDARYDPAADRILVLTREDGGTTVAILSRQGASLGKAQAPAGYAVSHFAAAGGPAIVCQGEAPDGAWWDWHFAVDPRGGEMRKTGPAY